MLEQWLRPPGWRAECSNELIVGGKYSQLMISDGSGSGCKAEDNIGYTKDESFPHFGEYLEIVKPTKLVFTWNSKAVNDSQVTVELRQLGGETAGESTELTLTHEFFETEQQKTQHNEGWNQCFDNLVQYLAES